MPKLHVYNVRFTHQKLRTAQHQTAVYVAAETRKRAADLVGVSDAEFATYGSVGAWTGLKDWLLANPEVALVETGGGPGEFIRLDDLNRRTTDADADDPAALVRLDFGAYVDSVSGAAQNHAAMGSIRASRVSGSRALFQVDYPQQHYITVEISTASLRRSTGTDWVFAEKGIVSVALSAVQWANFLSSMNSLPTPCTLEQYRDPTTGEFFAPRLDHNYASDAHTHRAEVEASGRKAVEKITQASARLREILAGPLRKGDLTEVLNLLSGAETAASANLGFAVQRAQEMIDEAQHHAEAEIDAHVDFAMLRLGERALGARLAQALEAGVSPEQVGESVMLALAPPQEVRDAETD